MKLVSIPKIKLLKRAAFLLGIVLFVINCVGLVIPLQNPKVIGEVGKTIKNRVVITPDEFYQRVERHGEAIPEYVIRVNQAVHERMIYYEWSKENGPLYWRMPFYQNYLIYLSRYVLYGIRSLNGTLEDPRRVPVLNYVFSNYKKVIERGIGLCSQHTIAVVGVLQQNGIEARMVGFDRHAITTAMVDPGKNTWWMLDADYGVVIPYDVNTIHANPAIVAPYYREKGYDEETVALVESLFASRFHIYNTIAEAHGKARYYFEFASYYLIWIIPCLLILPTLVPRITRVRPTPYRAKQAVSERDSNQIPA